MKAIVYREYGSTDNLHLEEVPKPIPKDNEVLVRIHAASVNSWDCDLVTGKPKIYRLLFGLFKPKHPIIGSDLAGVVKAVGNKVTQFKPGDEVFGDNSPSGFGTFAEYVAAPENNLRHKPSELSFEEAASLPQAGLLALQGLEWKRKIKPGQQILINGAGGGVGTIGIQLCKMWGAEVTAVDHTSKLENLKTLGADHVVDYTKTNYTQQGKEYDLILDSIALGKRADYKGALKPYGHFVMVGGDPKLIINVAFKSLFAKKSGQQLGTLAHKANHRLEELAQLCVDGKIKPIIDSTFTLAKTPEAIRKLSKGGVFGKVVINITPK